MVRIKGKPHVFRVSGTGSYQPVRVTLDAQSQDYVEVSDGLEMGSMVVVKGASLLLAAWEEEASE